MEAGPWDRYAESRSPRRLVNAAGASTWFNWTQYPDHGPGLEVLNLRSRSRVLDLGCGKGGNLAHIAAQGHHAVGVDVSGIQLSHAGKRWPDLTLVHGDALTYLEQEEDTFDAAYSVFGALWFLDPDAMLPALHRRLCGTLAFSYADMNGVSAHPRWDLEPDEWGERLDKYGFTDIEHQVIDPPDGAVQSQPTFLVRAKRQA